MSLHDRILEIIEDREGVLLSDEEITNRKQYIRVRCKDDHEWDGRVDHFLEGCWCRYCSNPNKLTLAVFQEVARSRGGKCLSTRYDGNKGYLLWECAEGHRWEATANNVKDNNTWCPDCGKITIEQIQATAVDRGGVCLNESYSPGCRLYFRCGEGHEWDTSLASIQHGHWCRICNQAMMERMCRAILERIFERPFPSQRPEWLQGECGRALELDCYNEDLQLALEMQGIQHTEE